MNHLDTLQNGFNHNSLLHFLVFGIIGWLFAYGIYRFGIGAAETYGLYIRVAYDLHRNKLLEYLNQTLTQSLEDDKNTWEKIGDFFIAGDLIKPIRFGSPKNLQQSKIIPGLAFAGGVVFGLLFKLVRSNRGRRAMV
jgi:hypothetical protein